MGGLGGEPGESGRRFFIFSLQLSSYWYRWYVLTLVLVISLMFVLLLIGDGIGLVDQYLYIVMFGVYNICWDGLVGYDAAFTRLRSGVQLSLLVLFC